jgi:hypothetical protein
LPPPSRRLFRGWEMAEFDLEALEALADAVRRASLAGEVVELYEIWGGGEEVYSNLTASPGAADITDIQLIRDGGEIFLFSDRHMTRAYAEAAVRAATGDHPRILAETVRSDSATYPRPTPIKAFLAAPYLLPIEDVIAAAERMRMDPRYADISFTRASNGDLFLFSSNHMNRAQAESMAEWLAVGQSDNP